MVIVYREESLEEKDRVIGICDEAFEEQAKSRPDYQVLLNKIHTYADFFVAKDNDNDNVCGYMAAYINDFDKGVAYISLLAVKPDCQGKHVGSLLMDSCVETAKSRGMKYIKLEVLKHNNQATRFYEKHGFYKTDECSEKSIYMIKELV